MKKQNTTSEEQQAITNGRIQSGIHLTRSCSETSKNHFILDCY